VRGGRRSASGGKPFIVVDALGLLPVVCMVASVRGRLGAKTTLLGWQSAHTGRLPATRLMRTADQLGLSALADRTVAI
jgi:hypothetical protein